MNDVSALELKRTFSLTPELSYTLPASWYHDPAIFEREKEAIFFKTWHYMGHSENQEARLRGHLAPPRAPHRHHRAQRMQ